MAVKDLRNNFLSPFEKTPDVKNFEELMLYEMKEKLKQDKYQEGISILLYYIILKADHSDFKISSTADSLETIEKTINAITESSETLLKTLCHKEFLTEADINRINALEKIVQMKEELTEDYFYIDSYILTDSPNRDLTNFYGTFLTKISKFTDLIIAAGIESYINSHLCDLAIDLKDIEEAAKERAIELMGLPEYPTTEVAYQMSTFAKLINIVWDEMFYIIESKSSERDLQQYIAIILSMDFDNQLDFLDHIGPLY